MLSLLLPVAHAATLSAPGTYGSVQATIDASAPGDTIVLEAGTYDEVLVVSHDLVIQGDVDSGTAIAPLAATSMGAAAAVYAAEGVALTIESVDIRGTTVRGVYGDAGSSLTLMDVTVSDSAAVGDGGGVFVDGDLYGTDLAFERITAGGDGGAAWVSGDLECTGCAFDDTTALGLGGAIHHGDGALRLTDVAYDDTVDAGLAAILTDSPSAELVRNRACDVTGFLFSSGGGGSIRASGIRSDEGGNALLLVTASGSSWELDHLTFIGHTSAILTYDLRNIPSLRDTATGDTSLPPIDTASPPGTAVVTNSLFVQNDSLLVPVYGDPVLLMPSFDHIAFDDMVLDPSVLVTNGLSGVEVDFVADRFGRSLDSVCPVETFLPTYEAPTIDQGSGTDPDGSPADIGASGGPDTWAEFHVDADGDGFTMAKECDDAEVANFPGNEEVCDGVDNDCDFEADLDATDIPTWFPDADGDGYGDGAAPAGSGPTQCEAPEPVDDGYGTLVPWAPNGSDCDDADDAVNPGALEDCDLSSDLDCDGSPDLGAADADRWWPDLDEDGFGDAQAIPLVSCTNPGPTYTAANGDDCNDASLAIRPDATETCGNGIDENCSGDESDAVDLTVWYPDADGDGYPATSGEVPACDAPIGGTWIPPRADGEVDCDDSEPLATPAGEEICDGIDNDCSGLADDLTSVPPTWYADDDGDGFGNADPAAAVATDCPADGYVAEGTDCDDTDAAVFPGAAEACNGRDDDCSGTPDDGPEQTWYVDGDGDGWGGEEVVTSCPRANLVEQGGDCQDAYPDVNPGAEEVPGNDVDEDCSGDATRPASSPSGEPAASGCQCSSSTPAGAWLGLFTLALVRLRRRSALAAVSLAACAPEPAPERLPEVQLTFATLAQATAEAPRFALELPDGPAFLQRDSRLTFRANGAMELRHRGTGSAPVTATLGLVGWGRDHLQPVPEATEPDVLGNRVVLERGHMVEWYLNGPDGIEQGFTLRERPGGRGPLRLAMSVDGLQVSGHDDALTFADADGVARFRYDKLMVLDRYDASVPAHLEAACDAPAACVVELVVDDGDAAYPLYVDPLLSEYVTDVNVVDVVGNLGLAVDVDGDRAVVGAPGDGNDGRVFILERNVGNPDAWGLEETLRVNGLDSFGTTVSLDDPYLAVGAPDSNTVNVYRRDAAWNLLGTPHTSPGGSFGAALDLQMPYLLIGEPEGDGQVYLGLLQAPDAYRPDEEFLVVPAGFPSLGSGGEMGTSLALRLPNLVVGAPGATGEAGVVAVYDGSGTEIQRIHGSPGERFGEVVSVSSARMAVGVPNAGVVRLYDLDPTASGEFVPGIVPELSAPAISESGFGTAVAQLNDTLLIGDQGTTAYAHQYAFVDGDTWLHTQSLPVATDSDGSTLGLALDSRTIVAGAPGAGTVGHAALWSRNSDVVVQDAVLQLDDGDNDNQGRAVAVDGDLAAVGDETAGTDYGGRVDLYANSGTGWALDATLLPAEDRSGTGELGHSVDIDGEVVVAGAPGVGEAFVYTRQAGTWVEERLLDPDGGQTRFGASIAVSGELLVVGDPQGRGRVQVYEFGGDRVAGPVEETINILDDGYGQPTVVQYGSSVAIEGNLIAIGGPGWDGAGGITDAGVVEIYRHFPASTDPAELVQHIEGTDVDGRCGLAVDIDVDRLAIGCPNDSLTVPAPGKAYLYRGNASSYTLEATGTGNTQENLFGTAVAIDDDRWFVAAKGNSKVRMYQRNTGGEDQWGEERIFDGPNGSNFGTDIDLDGNTVIVGAPLDGPLGSARIYTLDATIPPTLFDDSFVLTEDDVDVPLTLTTNDILAGTGFTDADAVTTNGPAAATLTRDSGQLLFTPDANVNGQQTFEYTLGDGNYATVTVDVLPVNDVPVAVDDAYDAREEVQLNGSSVLANDSDVESAVLTTNLLSAPSSAATFALAPDGTFVYEGVTDFFGIDTFTYEAIDGDGEASAPATVTITVEDSPEAPILSTSSWATDRDVPLEVAAPGLADPAYAQLPAVPTRFLVEDDDALAGTLLVLGNGGFTYTPGPGFTGPTYFVVRAESTGGFDTAVVTIDVLDTNQAPQPQPDAYTVREDTDLVVSLNGVLANDGDPDGDPLTALFEVPNQGELVSTSTDGTFTYRPPADMNGAAFFVYTVTDGIDVSAPVIVDLTIEPVNDTPVALDDAYDLDGPGPHVVPPEDGLRVNDSDIDGDTLVTTVLRAPDDGQLTIDPDGGFVFTPRLGAEGAITFEYAVSDGLATAKAAVEVTVTGNALPDDTSDTGPAPTVDTASPCDDEWFPDRDGDGWAEVGGEPRRACEAPPGFTDRVGDCDDARADRYPGAPEVQGDGVDQDCDGADADIAPAGACATGPGAGAGGLLPLLLLLLRRRQGVR